MGPREESLTIGVRPEHITIDPEGVPLRIDLVEPLGSETLVHGRLAAPGETSLVCAARGQAAGRRRSEYQISSKFTFSADTGLRLP